MQHHQNLCNIYKNIRYIIDILQNVYLLMYKIFFFLYLGTYYYNL